MSTERCPPAEAKPKVILRKKGTKDVKTPPPEPTNAG